MSACTRTHAHTHTRTHVSPERAFSGHCLRPESCRGRRFPTTNADPKSGHCTHHWCRRLRVGARGRAWAGVARARCSSLNAQRARGWGGSAHTIRQEVSASAKHVFCPWNNALTPPRISHHGKEECARWSYKPSLKVQLFCCVSVLMLWTSLGWRKHPGRRPARARCPHTLLAVAGGRTLPQASLGLTHQAVVALRRWPRAAAHN